ncbi:hypothetical protein HYH03_001662 [Edaphochlamys debaryana]|uniref:SKP1 component dimerisation domain-containing protein n=1 Tax=Edaphochlamys debaryana TaxID=47281 RepID=A0A835YGR1_9CHLO|nr:hypothetical protein HYH03_001662 [Edaphochlamys debaryana]|eukprot:KAG2500903.1 hypothetical protein HYH03_001662 [Edaphochlamys debaryana]
MAPSPETVTEDQAFPELPEYKHLILGPVDGDVIAPAAQTDVLLVIAPGAFIAPEAFTALGREGPGPPARICACGRCQLARRASQAKLILQALAAAEAAGFRPEREEYGKFLVRRLSNMVLMAHSASGALFPDAGAAWRPHWCSWPPPLPAQLHAAQGHQHRDLAQASNYLNINGLMDVCCKKWADTIKGRTPEEIRTLFNLEDDLTEEDKKKIMAETVWKFE